MQFTSIDVPPRLIKGKGCPVTGIKCTDTAICTKACNTINNVTPITNIAQNSESDCRATLPALNNSHKYRNITNIPIKKPNSSTIIAKMQSEKASGK